MKYKILILLICSVLIITGCSKEDATGTLAGDEVYQIQPYYFIQPDSREENQKSITESSPEFAYSAGTIYYTNQPKKSGPCRIMAIDINAQSLDEAVLFKDNEKVDGQQQNYMFTVKDNSLCCYDLDANNTLKLEISLPLDYAVLDNTLYYIAENSAFAVNIESGQSTHLGDGYQNLKAENGRLWLITTGGELCEAIGESVSVPVASGIISPNYFTVIENTLFYTSGVKGENEQALYSKELGSDSDTIVLDNIQVFYEIINVDGYVYATYVPEGKSQHILAFLDFQKSKSQPDTAFEIALDNPSDYSIKAYSSKDSSAWFICCGSAVLEAGSRNVLAPSGINLKTQVFDDLAIFMFDAKGQNFYFETYQLDSASHRINP
jgi:lipoprotein